MWKVISCKQKKWLVFLVLAIIFLLFSIKSIYAVGEVSEANLKFQNNSRNAIKDLLLARKQVLAKPKTMTTEEFIRSLEEKLKKLGVEYQFTSAGGRTATKGHDELVKGTVSFSQIYLHAARRPATLAHEVKHIEQIEEIFKNGGDASLLDQTKNMAKYEEEAYLEGFKVAVQYESGTDLLKDMYFQGFGYTASRLGAIGILSKLEQAVRKF